RGQSRAAQDGTGCHGAMRGQLAPAAGSHARAQPPQVAGHTGALRPVGRARPGRGRECGRHGVSSLQPVGNGSVAAYGRALVAGHMEQLRLSAGGELVTAGGRVIKEQEAVWLPPIEPRTILALALNYSDHAAELDLRQPEQ